MPYTHKVFNIKTINKKIIVQSEDIKYTQEREEDCIYYLQNIDRMKRIDITCDEGTSGSNMRPRCIEDRKNRTCKISMSSFAQSSTYILRIKENIIITNLSEDIKNDIVENIFHGRKITLINDLYQSKLLQYFIQLIKENI